MLSSHWDRLRSQIVKVVRAPRLGFIQSQEARTVGSRWRLEGDDRGHDLGALDHAVDVVEAHERHADVLSSVGL